MNKNGCFWENKRVLVTGGNGFLGKHLVRQLEAYHPAEIRIPEVNKFDLRKMPACKAAVPNIDVVIHLAAKVGGIGYNQALPGEMFYDNLIMGAQLMEAARLAGVKKFTAIGTVCAYPKYTPVPFKETDLWKGYPEETNAPYGLAKKMLLVQGQAYRQQYGFNSIYLLPVNLYGPGDNFDPKSSHVIPALIRKFLEAKDNGHKLVEVWGSGTATREFLYVADAARGIIMASEKYNGSEPVNLGSQTEISITDLVALIKELTGYHGVVKWNQDMPDGQPRRKLDVSRAKKEFGFEAKTDFRTGLIATIKAYKQETGNRKQETGNRKQETG